MIWDLDGCVQRDLPATDRSKVKVKWSIAVRRPLTATGTHVPYGKVDILKYSASWSGWQHIVIDRRVCCRVLSTDEMEKARRPMFQQELEELRSKVRRFITTPRSHRPVRTAKRMLLPPPLLLLLRL